MNLIGIIILLIVIVLGVVGILSKDKRKIGIVMLLCSIAFCFWQWHKEIKWAQEFAKVPNGVLAHEVIIALGRPSIIADSNQPPLGYSLADKNKNVKKELWYISFWLPEQYDFGFDEHGKLIDRYHYVSP
jgi:hypothetical protein